MAGGSVGTKNWKDRRSICVRYMATQAGKLGRSSSVLEAGSAAHGLVHKSFLLTAIIQQQFKCIASLSSAHELISKRWYIYLDNPLILWIKACFMSMMAETPHAMGSTIVDHEHHELEGTKVRKHFFGLYPPIRTGWWYHLSETGSWHTNTATKKLEADD